ncbi:MAG: ThuA domain-containing protein [Gemmataceae bacterium]|nr:ThuA domain-containing protein [Gemmataceae bacterium]
MKFLFTRLLALALGLLLVSPATAAEKIKALILDGQNNHNWKATSPMLQKILKESGLFTVEVVTSPAKGGDIAQFKPNFKDFHVVISNYNGQDWSKETQKDLVEFVSHGGGFVSVHAADNAFPGWAEYNEIIGVGGWGGRNEKSGPYIRLKDGKFVNDMSKGNGGSHGRQHQFKVVTRNTEHPITKGLPPEWLHNTDELYDRLRGPAKNLTVLATAFADKSTGGSGEHEPMLMALDFGKGRSFHTTLGHAEPAMKCVGFAVTLVRGCEWAATGKVTHTELPKDFPTTDKVSIRE